MTGGGSCERTPKCLCCGRPVGPLSNSCGACLTAAADFARSHPHVTLRKALRILAGLDPYSRTIPHDVPGPLFAEVTA
jgi:hypothetical protein